jgi:hypothetical protein
MRSARWSASWRRPLHTGLLIATFHRATPVRCGAFVDERCVVAGDERQTRNANTKRSSIPAGSATPPSTIRVGGQSCRERTCVFPIFMERRFPGLIDPALPIAQLPDAP